MRDPIQTVCSHALVLPDANIDTDQIVPARFLTTTAKEGLGQHAFADWRSRAGSPFADPRAATAKILVAGDNFGCGSSREHAPWALLDFGFRAVLSTSFADIFRNNAVKNGLLPIIVPAAFQQRLLTSPWPEVAIDLEQRTCRHEDEEACFPIDNYERECLLLGRDDFDQLLAQLPAIKAFEQAST